MTTPLVATIIDPFATALVYLVLSVGLSTLLLICCRRPIASWFLGCTAAIAASVWLAPWFPANYWAHANEFIYEPLFCDGIFGNPFAPVLSLAFHFGVPAVIFIPLARCWLKRDLAQANSTASAKPPENPNQSAG